LPRGRAGLDALDALLAGRRETPGDQEAEDEGTLLLVVDDHPTNLMVLTRQLASLGYAAHTATDGELALQAWKSRRYAAIITDCNMPKMNGYQLTSAIRALEQMEGMGRTPIIACTANALPGAAAMCLDQGMDACLVKPAGLAQISAALDRWVPLTRLGARLKDLSSAELPTAIAGGGLVDFFLLAEISGGNVQAQAEILAEFRRVSQADAEDLRRSVQAGDYPLIVQCAHRMSGASLMLGANKLAAACSRIESGGAAKDADAVRGALEGFEDELRQLHDYFDTLL
ncbi:MAG: sensor histidine kinase, partial [Comamonadaceae bacterium]